MGDKQLPEVVGQRVCGHRDLPRTTALHSGGAFLAEKLGGFADGLGRFTDDKFGIDHDLIAKALQAVKAIQNALGGNFSHIREGLADRRESRVAEGCQLNVVKADYRYVGGNAETEILQRAYGANGGHIIE